MDHTPVCRRRWPLHLPRGDGRAAGVPPLAAPDDPALSRRYRPIRARLSGCSIASAHHIEEALPMKLTLHRAEDRGDQASASRRCSPATVYQDAGLVGEAPSRMRATNVTFTPGARTAWHQHPVGQTLWVVYGVGRVCRSKGSRLWSYCPGDTAIIPPNVRHWHGAAPDRIFTHSRHVRNR